MRQLAATALLAALGWVAGSVAATSAFAATLCVGPASGCYATIQGALDAAHHGDTINVAAGTFAGGITIDKSVRLVGAGAASTIIRGGGPVITIGSDGSGPTVGITGVTVTGGLNNSSPGPSSAAGGGVEVATGAKVTIADSVVSGNAVAPRETFPDPTQACGDIPHDRCAFADGGGIDNSGSLVLIDTVVSHNVAGEVPGLGPVASNAEGGGIASHSPGTLTLRHSTVTDNQAVVGLPNGRFTDGGGIFDGGVLTIQNSVVSDNSSDVAASVASSFPFDVEQEANGGGINSGDESSVIITGSTISGNTVSSTNSGGDAQAVNGGLVAGGLSLAMTNSAVADNHVTASVPPASGFLAGAISGGLQNEGVGVIRSSRVSDNSVSASSANGTANAAGAGIGNLSGRLRMERVAVAGNHGAALGLGGLVDGGGILNVQFGGNPPELTVVDGTVTGNTLAATPGITPMGGGLFTADPFSLNPFPVTLIHTLITGNSPDQCFGC